MISKTIAGVAGLFIDFNIFHTFARQEKYMSVWIQRVKGSGDLEIVTLGDWNGDRDGILVLCIDKIGGTGFSAVFYLQSKRNIAPNIWYYLP